MNIFTILLSIRAAIRCASQKLSLKMPAQDFEKCTSCVTMFYSFNSHDDAGREEMAAYERPTSNPLPPSTHFFTRTYDDQAGACWGSRYEPFHSLISGFGQITSERWGRYKPVNFVTPINIEMTKRIPVSSIYCIASLETTPTHSSMLRTWMRDDRHKSHATCVHTPAS